MIYRSQTLCFTRSRSSFLKKVEKLRFIGVSKLGCIIVMPLIIKVSIQSSEFKTGSISRK